jgi:hypothetical protein
VRKCANTLCATRAGEWALMIGEQLAFGVAPAGIESPTHAASAR